MIKSGKFTENPGYIIILTCCFLARLDKVGRGLNEFKQISQTEAEPNFQPTESYGDSVVVELHPTKSSRCTFVLELHRTPNLTVAVLRWKFTPENLPIAVQNCSCRPTFSLTANKSWTANHFLELQFFRLDRGLVLEVNKLGNLIFVVVTQLILIEVSC